MEPPALPEKFQKLLNAFDGVSYPLDDLNEVCLREIRHRPNQLIGFIDAALVRARTTSRRRVEGWLHLWKSWALNTLSSFPKASEEALASLTILRQLEDPLGQFKACNAMTVNSYSCGMLDDAVSWAVKAEELAERTNDTNNLKTALLNTANIHIRLESWSDAIEILDRAANLPTSTEGSELALIINRATCLLGSGKYHLARRELTDAMVRAEKQSISTYVIECMVLTGRIEFHEGQAEKALDHYNAALKKAKAVGDRWFTSEIHRYTGECLRSMGRMRQALNRLQQGLVLAEETHDRIVQAAIHLELSKLLETTRPARALEHFKAYHHLDRNVFSQRTTKNLDEERRKRQALETDAYKTMFAQISTISALGQEITASLSLEEILETVHDKILTLMPADTFGLALYTPETDSLDYAFFIDDGRRLPSVKVPLVTPNSLGSWCFNNSKEIMSNSIEADWPEIMNEAPRSLTHGEVFCRRSVIFVPILAHGERLGILSVQASVHNAYTLYHLDSLKALASYVAIAIENARLFQDVQHRATYDHLTGILNRPTILGKAEDEFQRVRRYGGKLSVLMVDVDHFKQINDQHGHQAGDVVIREVARHLSSHLRDVDFAGRYGGEEFLIVLPETDREGANILAERIRSTIVGKVLYTVGSTALSCTLSIGGHELGTSEANFDDTIKHADESLYWCKANGRNCCKFS